MKICRRISYRRRHTCLSVRPFFRPVVWKHQHSLSHRDTVYGAHTSHYRDFLIQSMCFWYTKLRDYRTKFYVQNIWLSGWKRRTVKCCSEGCQIWHGDWNRITRAVWNTFCKLKVTSKSTAIIICCLTDITYRKPFTMAARSKAYVCGLSRAGIAGSNPPETWISVSCECCLLSGRALYVVPITLPGEPYLLWCV
jgi:hypothetical protein